MRTLLLAGAGAALVALNASPVRQVPPARYGSDLSAPSESHGSASLSPEDLTMVVGRYCVTCHNDRRLRGDLSLETFDVGRAPALAPTAEKMIRKLRAGMMPPPGARRPTGDTLTALAETLETLIDRDWASHPQPGNRTFQRLNRAEYERAIKDLLDLDIDAGEYLPLDTKSANFDNIADVQMMSPTQMDAYLRAADEVARAAVGVPNASPTSITYTNSSYVSQWERVPGAPRGTRGGISVIHNFPADAQYTFKLWFEHTTTGEFYGAVTPGEQIEISIDGERVVLEDVDRWMHTHDPNEASQATDPVFVRAGPHRVTAAFLQVNDGPLEDLLSPHDWSVVDRKIGTGGYGITAYAHLKDLVIHGPYDPTGVSETPSRRAIFTCRPTSPQDERPCAESIVRRLASRAFRRPVEDDLLQAYMKLYDERAAEDGFEVGIRTALQGILASPDFVFRFEQAPPDDLPDGGTYRISDLDLATRLSYFLWDRPPDATLLQVAEAGRLSKPEVLESQVRRMLADSRAEALGTRFAAQWLRLDDLDKVHPDRLMFPDYYQQLADDMRRETELFFNSIVQDDRSVFDLYSADYTFVNERLAKHYGMMGVSGEDFRRVTYQDDHRRGLLGHGSILTLTSHANRTSPVLRGKWVMEVLLGTPPPPPPPNVPALEQTAAADNGRLLTTAERMKIHRANPTCNSCHRFIDPIGLALDNFDPTGRWRIKENQAPVDAAGELYDGTPVNGPAQLEAALMARPVMLVRTFTENLMTYALGRRLEYYDMPAVRKIERDAQKQDNRISAFILGVIESDAFQMRSTPATEQAQNSKN